MGTIRHDVSAACPPERIWALLSDLEAVQRYNPTVRTASLRGPLRGGLGAERVCDLAPRGRVVERVVHWEDGRAVGLEIVESDWPVRSMRWVTRVEPAAGGSRIRQELEYAMKFGPLGWLLDRLVLRRKLSRSLDEVLARLVRMGEGP